MMEDPWIIAVVAVAYTVMANLVYERWFTAGGADEQPGAFRSIPDAMRTFLVRKFMGLFLFGIVSLVLMVIFFSDVSRDWLLHLPGPMGWLLVVAGMALTATVGFFGSRQEKVRKLYPEMRMRRWKPFHFSLSVAGWFVYLAGYEFLFRGFLLYLSIPAMGLPLAVALNVVLYALLHWRKSPKEALGAIPFGIILCLLTIHTGSLLAPVLVHLGLSASTEIFSFRRNPEMKLAKNGN